MQSLNEYMAYTTQIVSSYVGNHQVMQGEIKALIDTVYETVATAETRRANQIPTKPPLPEPAVPIKKSVTPDFIICLEDGKKLKMLKRHLRASYNMTPEEYRERWSLPADYPMVAQNYAQRRTEIAKESGLGTSPHSRRSQGSKA